MALRADDVDIGRDRALVRRFQAGDDDAFGELYRRYHDRLERFCFKRLGDQHAAEEVAQEAFTRALSALPELAGEQRFYPWVSVIAARLCVDHFRLQARSEPRSDPNPGGVSGGQEEGIVGAVDSSLVVAALARLAPRHQDVLHLREVESWSYQQIADHYGVTVGTVETLLFRARKALRREFHLVDGAGLAVVPVLGWLVQRAGRVRAGLSSWLPSLPIPATVAAAATATAAVVALAVVPAQAPPRATSLPAPVHGLAPVVSGGRASPMTTTVALPAGTPLADRTAARVAPSTTADTAATTAPPPAGPTGAVTAAAGLGAVTAAAKPAAATTDSVITNPATVNTLVTLPPPETLTSVLPTVTVPAVTIPTVTLPPTPGAGAGAGANALPGAPTQLVGNLVTAR